MQRNTSFIVAITKLAFTE